MESAQWVIVYEVVAAFAAALDKGLEVDGERIG